MGDHDKPKPPPTPNPPPNDSDGVSDVSKPGSGGHRK